MAMTMYTEELLKLIRETENEEELREKLDEYHDNDIATAFEELSSAERIKMYGVIGDKWASDIIQFYDFIYIGVFLILIQCIQ